MIFLTTKGAYYLLSIISSVFTRASSLFSEVNGQLHGFRLPVPDFHRAVAAAGNQKLVISARKIHKIDRRNVAHQPWPLHQ